MNIATKKRLLKHIDRSLYDMKGFIDYNKLRERIGIKAKALAHAIGKTSRALEKNPQSEKIQNEFKKLVYILVLLKEMLSSEDEISIWLKAPNPDYDGLSPLDIITEGKSYSIISYLEDIQKGALT